MQHEPSDAENTEVQERDDDAEKEELVVFKNFDQYIAKQDEFLSLPNTQSDRSTVLLLELEKEVRTGAYTDQHIPRTSVSTGCIPQ